MLVEREHVKYAFFFFFFQSTSDASDDIEIAQSSSVDLHFSPSQIAKIIQVSIYLLNYFRNSF